MALYLANNRDQALLAQAIQQAGAVADAKNTYLGRTAVQKIMYFLKALGVPMGYKFEIYHYGPFSEAILRDVDYLLADRVINDKSNDAQKYSNYRSGEALNELLAMYHDDLTSYQELVSSVVNTLAPLQPAQLELLSTLDYLYRQEKASGRTSEWKTTIVSRFIQAKGTKFPETEVARMYETMAAAKMVEA